METFSSKSVSVLLLVLVASVNLASAAETTNTAFIKTSCSATTYPTLCYNSLSSHATTIKQNSKLLAQTSLSVSLSTAQSTFLDIVKLSHSAGMTPREVGAIKDCLEELTDSVDQLKKSMTELSQINAANFEIMISDIQTWVSAALTDEDTCTDGFGGKYFTNGPLKTAVREKILNVAHMTSNALALINSYAALDG